MYQVECKVLFLTELDLINPVAFEDVNMSKFAADSWQNILTAALVIYTDLVTQQQKILKSRYPWYISEKPSKND